MAFKGDLRNVHLADILQTLAQNQQEGVLTLTARGEKQRILFTNSGISLLDSKATGRRRLGEILLRSKVIEQTDLDEALRQQARTGRFLGEVLIEQGVVDDDQLQRILQIQVEEELYDLFRIMEGTFEFSEEESSSFDSQIAPFHVDGVVLEAARRLDEWQVIGEAVPDLGRVYVPEDIVQPRDLDEEEEVVLDYLDGRHTVQNAADALLSSPFSVAKVLARLLDRGTIRETTVEERLAAVDACLETGQKPQALALLEGILEESADDAVLARLPPLFREAGDSQQAAKVRIRLAEVARQRGDSDQAWHHLNTARKESPDSPEVLERLANIAADQGEQEVEARLRRQTAALLSARGDFEGALECAERVHELLPSDREVRLDLIDLCVRGRRKARAVELLLREAEELRDPDKSHELALVYKRILSIDPQRTDIKKALRKTRRTKAERLRILAIVGVVVVGMLGSGLFFFLDWKSEQESRTMLLEATALFHQGEHRSAKAMAQGLLDAGPKQEMTEAASALLDRIDRSLTDSAREARLAEEAAFDEQLRVIQLELDEGRFEEALGQLFELLGRKQPADLRERARTRLRGALRELSDHVAKATELAAAYRSPTRDSDVAGAYDRLSLAFPAETLQVIEGVRGSLQRGRVELPDEAALFAEALTAVDAWRRAFQRMQPEIVALRGRFDHLQLLEDASEDYLAAERALEAGDIELAAGLYRRALRTYGDGELRAQLKRRIDLLDGAVETTESLEKLLVEGKIDIAQPLGDAALKDYAEVDLVQALELPVRIDSRPQGASVFSGDRKLGTCPLVLRLRGPSTRAYTLRKDGYEPMDVEVAPHASIHALGELKKAVRLSVPLGAAAEAAPIWHEGAVWASLRDGSLRRVDPNGGSQQRFSTDSLSGSRCSPLGTSEGVLHTTADGRMWLVRFEGGELSSVWTQRFPEPLVGSAMVWNGQVLGVGADGTLRAADLRTGARLEGGLSLGDKVVAPPMVLGDRLFVPLRDHKVASVDLKERSRLLDYPLDGEVHGGLCTDGQVLIAVSSIGRFQVLRLSDARRIATFDVGGAPISSPVLDDGFVDVSLDGELARVDLIEQRVTERWTLPGLASAVAHIGNELWVGDRDGLLYAFVSGHPEPRFDTPLGSSPLVDAPVPYEDLVAVLCEDGTLVILVR